MTKRLSAGTGRCGSRYVAVAGLGLSLFLGLAAPVTAVAEAPPPLVLAVFDAQRAVMASSAGMGVRKQVDQYAATYQNEVAKVEKELHDADQELARQRTLVSSEAFAEKQNEFRQRVAETQRTVEQRRRNLDKVAGVALQQIQKKVLELSIEVASEQKVTLVLDATSALFFDPRYDITDRVIERLNKAIPKVAVEDPSKVTQPAAGK
ncbi:MAG: OmpH family outer membrane protein [Alphaproteobacteria bacterium]